jgi:hypothetical protein
MGKKDKLKEEREQLKEEKRIRKVLKEEEAKNVI